MSQVMQKLSEIEGQLDTELKTIDRKMKELKQEKLTLTNLKRALRPTAPRKKKEVNKEIIKEGGNG